MDIQLLPFAQERGREVEDISRAIFPEYHDGSVKWKAGWQLDDPAAATAAYVAVEPNGDRAVGYAAIRPRDGARYRLNLMVRPDWQERGIGRALFDRIGEDLDRLEALAVKIRVRADMLAGLEFVRQRDFAEVHRMRGMALEVGYADLSTLHERKERIAAQGIAISTLATERRDDPDCMAKLHALHNSALPTWPNPDPTRPLEALTREEFLDYIEAMLDNPEACFVAELKGRYVGYGGIGTAVHPQFRGLGLATLLKMRYIELARRNDLKTLYSQSANPAIIAINKKLGYRTERVEVRFVKRMK